MTRIALVVALVAAPGVLAAQRHVGEIRILGTGAWAPRPGNAHTLDYDAPPPDSRALVGSSVALSFIAGKTGRITAGPEFMAVFGSDRRAWGLGLVGRVALSDGRVRPYVLLGGGWDVWDRYQAFSGQPAVWTNDHTYFRFAGGAGVLADMGAVSLVVELRAHENPSVDEFFGSRRLVALSTGIRVAW